jgi:hypothetical protein
VDHFFLSLFFFAVPLRLILVFFAFRFFAMKALMPLREPDSGQPNARRGLYQCSEMHNRGGGDDLVRHGLERCGLAENFPGPEDGSASTLAGVQVPRPDSALGFACLGIKADTSRLNPNVRFWGVKRTWLALLFPPKILEPRQG